MCLSRYSQTGRERYLLPDLPRVVAKPQSRWPIAGASLCTGADTFAWPPCQQSCPLFQREPWLTCMVVSGPICASRRSARISSNHGLLGNTSHASTHSHSVVLESSVAVPYGRLGLPRGAILQTLYQLCSARHSKIPPRVFERLAVTPKHAAPRGHLRYLRRRYCGSAQCAAHDSCMCVHLRLLRLQRVMHV